MIYTSNFSTICHLPPTIIPIAICGKSLRWYTGLEYKKLAPKYQFFMEWKYDHNNEKYIHCFRHEVLYSLDPHIVLEELLELSNSKDICLICYELAPPEQMTFEEIMKSDQYFCHRHLVADWFTQNGIECEEYR